MKPRSLSVLAILFGASCLGRAAVLASDLDRAGDTASDHEKSVSVRDTTKSKSKCVDGTFAASLIKNTDALVERDAALAEREQLLKIFQKQIDKRLATLEDANKLLTNNVQSRTEARSDDIAKLASIYEGMKPRQAGEIINEMDPAFASGLLAAMNSQSAAQIVANMDAKKAYTISVLLASQSQRDSEF